MSGGADDKSTLILNTVTRWSGAKLRRKQEKEGARGRWETTAVRTSVPRLSSSSSYSVSAIEIRQRPDLRRTSDTRSGRLIGMLLGDNETPLESVGYSIATARHWRQINVKTAGERRSASGGQRGETGTKCTKISATISFGNNGIREDSRLDRMEGSSSDLSCSAAKGLSWSRIWASRSARRDRSISYPAYGLLRYTGWGFSIPLEGKYRSVGVVVEGKKPGPVEVKGEESEKQATRKGASPCIIVACRNGRSHGLLYLFSVLVEAVFKIIFPAISGTSDEH
ncbi:hypothetical protein DFH08DRAFT_825694 [Mycena albidolilacea]|uniref:Uncharacterized protein n=1 Tax=Mycena albidolilacea TaxID=1033008 RepID=A0AAD7E925_9AGAR|nr:hypothetical protein DFH08DRAFT_825694 [Mycena albidolilacea]